MMEMRKAELTWTDIDALAYDLAKRIHEKHTKPFMLYGVPRGGIHAASALLKHLSGGGELVTSPGMANIIIDDIIDTGETRKRYHQSHPRTPFYALVTKTDHGEWYSFPWERMCDEEGPEDNVRRILEFIGDDPKREGLIETPKRVVKSWKELYSGYKVEPKSLLKAFEDGACDEMVVLKNIEFYSSCVIGSTFVDTPRGRVPIQQIKDGDWVYTVDPATMELGLARCENPRITKRKSELVRVITDNDVVICTPDHRFLLVSGDWVEAKDLKSGHRIASLYRAALVSESDHVLKGVRLIASRWTRSSHKNLRILGSTEGISEHEFVMRTLGLMEEGKLIHHKDEKPWHNNPENLECLTTGEHNLAHRRGEKLALNPKRILAASLSSGRAEVRAKRSASVKRHWDSMSSEERSLRNAQIAEGIRSHRNHVVIAVEAISEKEDVWCMTVPGTHTLFTNGMASHNCEHHMVPFFGQAHIGYIPDGKVVGVSKLARLLEVFSRRLQIQERIGQQVTEILMKELKPKGAACVLSAKHLCMCARGVGKQHSEMVTSSLRGTFLEPAVRSEFFRMIGM